MIDDPGRVASLIEQMHSYLPLPAFPTKELVRTLRRRGVKASIDRTLSIKRGSTPATRAGLYVT